MNFHLLDRPVWNALRGPQAALAIAGTGAVRLDPRYGPFAAAPAPDPAGLAALAAMVTGPGDALAVLEPEIWPAPPGMRVADVLDCVQMVHDGAPRPAVPDAEIQVLGEADAPAMAALAQAAQPGPWADWTHRYGPFFGIRRENSLVAMAGERLRPAYGLTEVSGVATDASCRGQGLAEQVIAAVVAGLLARGDRPFLHCRSENAAAIRLYERMGFAHRRRMMATIFTVD